MRYQAPDDAAGKTAGRLFRIAADGSVGVEKTGIGIANTLCWSPDARLFYFGDTDRNSISVWDYDAAAGTVANERPFFSGFARGGPDGSAMDSDGYLWNARYGGGCVVRVAPSGKVDRVIEMPVPNVTTCTFGGPDLRTLYITTARGGTGDALRLSGGLFALPVDVPGMPENRFRLAK
jgi:sugar lactone lactonase YvrE